ncbi:polysaccharide deacetylase family protein [Marinobacter zhejiangensis]|uniref:Polysaccharide deacetylase n=1 Tax=Marinobacter zhejiangensis TaxID=488535 RepID=A0A1I4RF26_9GAMM|nr:Polysaccharide deacetylase [Marinobacter zhejiangensis]
MKYPIRQTILAALSLLLTMPGHADLVILQYHHISDEAPPSTSTTQSLFRSQLDMISDLSLEVVPLDQGTEAALNGSLHDTQQIAISFDDAYDSILHNAAPLLLERELPFTVFVNTDSVGHTGYLTWDQLKELQRHPLVHLANHSADHDHLVRRSDEAEPEWRQRVTTSLDRAQATIKRRLGTDTPLFAYPYGEFSSELEALVASRGWYGYGQQSGAVGSSTAATRIPRFPMATGFGQLATLKDKLLSKAFPIDGHSLPDSPIATNPPTLMLELPTEFDEQRLACFASGQGRIPVTVTENGVSAQAPRAFSSRRFRYNCTYPAGDGRYFWLSQGWLDRDQPED